MMSENQQQVTPVTQALDELGISYRFFQHPGPVHSLEQAAQERGQRPEQVIRSIVFRLNPGEYLMVLVAGPQQISWPALRKQLGMSRLTMASREEVLSTTGYETGAVSPFGLPEPMRLLADESIFQEAEVSIGSGVRGTTVILTQAALQEALRLSFGEVERAHLSES
jgi:Cys-tRNA(Pro)/Cys-tRNA(Cys) deacylase